MLRRFAPLLFLIWALLIGAKYPNLSPNDVQVKVNEILKCHATYKDLNPELIERILINYIHELDPAKVYLIEPEILEWTQPSKELKASALRAFKQSDFSVFEKIHDVLVKALERREELEKQSKNLPDIKNIDNKKLREEPYPKTKEELLERIKEIKALQLDAASKISDESVEQFINRIRKRRLSRESEIRGATPDEKRSFILSHLLKATCKALDAHTYYFTPQEANQFLIQVQQSVTGIGALLRDNLNGFGIVRIIENGPADKSKLLKINDLIVAVNKEPIMGMDIEDAVEKIRGEKNTKVHLTILRDDEKSKEKKKLEVDIERGEVVLEEGRLQTSIEPFGDGVIAHLRLFSFYHDPQSSSAHDIKKALDKIQKENHLKGVVLDLRNNGGGHLTQAVEVTSLFISKGIVVSIKEHTGLIQHKRNTNGKVTWDGPLVVLCNRASVSAAEIVTQALQDYGRAIIVGDNHTFGKGTYQTFTYDSGNTKRKINPKGEYKVTRGIYYTVSGKTPQQQGVMSDIVVPGILSEMEIGEKFEKYPLENDTIEPHFEDSLEDIPIEHRKRLSLLYKHNLQQKISTYTQYLDILNKNSKKRIDGNKNYQNFLKAIKDKKFETEDVEIFGQSDLQLIECFNVIKDLIFLIEISDKYAASF